MRVLIAPDSFKESLSAGEVARAMADGVRDVLARGGASRLQLSYGARSASDVPYLGLLQRLAASHPEQLTVTPVISEPQEGYEGETGLFASTGEEWQAAIRKMAQSPAQARTMGTNARPRVAEAFSLQAVGQQWVDMLIDAAK